MDKPYGILSKITKYSSFWLQSKNRHDVHSPFVFDFVESVLNKKNKDKAVEDERKKLLKDHSEIFINDLGAGKDRSTSVSAVASNSLKKTKEAGILAGIVKHYAIDKVIEFGTSLGITTAYMARARNDVQVYSIEGSAQLLSIAKSVWDSLGITNIDSYQSDFDSFLFQNNNIHYKKTLIFIDGNHKYTPTIKYFNHFLKQCADDCILVFDDIHWSDEMERAWEEIIASEDIFLSLDLFEMGIVFLDKRMEKEHFNLRY